MITPNSITNYNRTEAELEEFLLFAILVAGKSAEQQAKKLEQFLAGCPYSKYTPFQYLEYLIKTSTLTGEMMRLKLGQYKRLTFAFIGILKFKDRLKEVTIEELESVYGVGCKTARFFVLHSRPAAKVAVLDTHILKWMKALGHNVPKATPTKRNYSIIEKIFLTIAEAKGMSVAELDLQIWKSYAN